MAKKKPAPKKKPADLASVKATRHQDSRPNIPTRELGRLDPLLRVYPVPDQKKGRTSN